MKAGKRTLLLEDHDRPNWIGHGNRPLVCEIWYPASDDSDTTVFGFGSPEPLFQFDAIAIDAEINSKHEKYPLILLSHGTGGTALGMGWLGQYLASQGYIAVAVNHHGNNAIEPYLAHGFHLWWERATDLSVITDKLLSEITEFRDRIDSNRIGVAGFSLGGFTAIMLAGGRCCLDHFNAFCTSDQRDGICDGPREFPTGTVDIAELAKNDECFRESMNRHHLSYRDERIKAAFAIAPALGMAFSTQDLASIDIPVQIVVTEIDNDVPPATNAFRFARLISNARLEVLPGEAEHYVFLCEATAHGKHLEPAICIDHPSVNRRDVHQRVSQLAVSFFDTQPGL